MSPLPLSQLRITGELGLIVFLSLVQIEFASGRIKLLLALTHPYSAKYASSFYGPFREASSSTPQFGNRESYQLNIANKREAFREIDADIKEGADIVMVKPALAFLDIINKSHDLFNTPLAAFNVSGEYSMVHAAAQQGWIDKNKIILEILTSIKRSGANLIITWHAKEIAEFIQTNN